MFYVIPLWIALLTLWPWLKRQRLADRLSVTRVPLVLVIIHCLMELKGITESPQWFWIVPTKLGIAWLAITCMLASFGLDILDGRVARDSKLGGTKWGRFWDATTDKLSTWPVAILLWVTTFSQFDVWSFLAWHLPVSLLLGYDIWSTRNHYLKAKQADDKREHDVGKNKFGHIAGQVKHWSWSIMIGIHVFALCPVIPGDGNSISNLLARFGAWLVPSTFAWVIIAVIAGAVSMMIRRSMVKTQRPSRPPVAEAATRLVDSSPDS